MGNRWDRNFDDIKPYLKDRKVLDVGAAAGKNILPFCGKGSKGLDRNPGAPNIIKGNATGFERGEKFDVVTMCSIIEHLPSKEHVRRAFRQAHKHLRDDGLVIVQCPHAFDTGAWYEFEHELALTHHSVMQGLESVGFRIEGAWTHLRLPFDQAYVQRFGVVKLPISSDYIVKLLATANLARDVVVVGRKVGKKGK